MRLQITQSRRYGSVGIGIGGALLKHSLYPLKYLAGLLPVSGTIVDLGCGEGMLTNLLAHSLPGVRFIGIDRDPDQIEKASTVAEQNSSFQVGNIADCRIRGAAAIIFNDVLHHNPSEQQAGLLELAGEVLDDAGVIILKEVDAEDWADVRWTRFWDSRLYPDDPLDFQTMQAWKTMLRRAGFRILQTYRSRHPWPASRTIIVATKRPKLAGSAPIIGPSVLPPTASSTSLQATEPVKVLVTGATGFVGEHMVRELLRSGIDDSPVRLSLVVRDPLVLPSDLRASEEVEILETDLRNIGQYAETVAHCEFVFHLAAHVDFFSGEEIFDENLEQVRRLLAVCSKSRLKRFVYTSTIGAVDRSPVDNCATPLDEQSEPHSVSHYGRSKLEGERLVAASGLPYTIIRIPWCYGPGMSHTHHVRALFERVLAGGLAVKFAWPGRVSLIEVGSATRALRDVAADPETLNELYCVTDGEPISFGELFSEMGRMSGRRAGYLTVPVAFVALASAVRRWMPFQLKCLLMDAMVSSNAKLLSSGHQPTPRSPEFLRALVRYVHQERSPSRHRSRVLITGAAGGIGRSISQRFNRLGYSLLLIDRDELALNALAEELGADQRTVDLSDETECHRLADDLEVGDEAAEVVINNAGIGARGDYESISHERHLDMIKVNCIAPVLINRAVLPIMIKNGVGTIINVASSAAFQPLPYMAVYAASKAFVLNYSQAVAGEVGSASRTDVRVISIVPSGTNTNFQRNAGVRETSGLLDADYVADRIAASIGQRRHTVVIGLSGYLMSLGARVVSTNFRPFLWGRLMRRMR